MVEINEMEARDLKFRLRFIRDIRKIKMLSCGIYEASMMDQYKNIITMCEKNINICNYTNEDVNGLFDFIFDSWGIGFKQLKGLVVEAGMYGEDLRSVIDDFYSNYNLVDSQEDVNWNEPDIYEKLYGLNVSVNQNTHDGLMLDGGSLELIEWSNEFIERVIVSGKKDTIDLVVDILASTYEINGYERTSIGYKINNTDEYKSIELIGINRGIVYCGRKIYIEKVLKKYVANIVMCWEIENLYKKIDT